MLFTCYNYNDGRITNTVIFVKDKNIINVYTNVSESYDDNYDNYNDDLIMLFIITDEEIKNYPILYRIYIASILLTADPTKLIENEFGYYITKKTVKKNLHITKYYNCENTYMFSYPNMSHSISSKEHIDNNIHIITNMKLIKPEKLYKLITDEYEKIKKYLDIF
jgi:hypothetical protein